MSDKKAIIPAKPEPPAVKHPGYKLRLDDGSIRDVAASYPPEVQEDVMWLAIYARERCSRQLSVLEGIVKKLGFSSSASIFYKIFTGRYFLPDPKRPGKIIGSVQNFAQLVGTLRSHYRIQQVTGKIPFIETPTWELIEDYITVRRAPDRICKFGVIIGPTGAQKSESFREYVRRNNHGKCVHLESPHSGSMSQFITDLAGKYGASVWSNQQNKLAMILDSVDAKRTIIVDNVQRLYDVKAAGDQPVFNFLQKLQDDTDCTVILSFTPDFEKVMTKEMDRGYFEQFEGRTGGRGSFLHLDEKASRDDVLAIARGFDLRFDEKADIEYLEKLAHSPGRIRILFSALQDAQQLAQATGAALDIDHIREVRGEVAGGAK